jgi:hypothetical protein
MWDVTVLYRATDATGTPECSLSVGSNEPIDGPGDGNTNVDWQVIGPHHVRLRAERAADGTGRIYTITVTCADSSGNVPTGKARVFVPRWVLSTRLSTPNAQLPTDALEGAAWKLRAGRFLAGFRPGESNRSPWE